MTTVGSKSGSRTTVTIAALCTGTALSALNSGMIAVALATLRRDFTLDVAGVTWVITTYYLASAALQPLMGRLADRFGPRRLFVIGMCFIMLAGAVAPFAPTFWVVCAARVLLAVGTATAFPSAVAMLHSISQASGRSATKMIGRIQMVDTGTTALGPVVGGLLVTQLGWQAIFWINIPLAAIALVSTLTVAPADGERPKSSLRTTIVESDIPGVLAFAVTIVALLAFLLDFPGQSRWWLLAVVAAAAALFAWRELRTREPFVDLRLLGANIPLLRVYACFALVNLLFYSVLFGLPQYLEKEGGYRTDAVGALMIPLAGFTLLLTPFVERLIAKRGARFTLIVGGVGMIVATIALAALSVSTAVIIVLLVTAAMGIPYCVLVISLTRALYAAAPPDSVGEATGLFQTSRCIGGITSTVIVGISFASGITESSWIVVAGALTVLAICYLVLVVVWRPRTAA